MKTTGTLEAGTGTWWGPNLDATNSSGFTCLPSGARYGDGAFEFICQYTYFWSSTAYWTRHLGFNYPSVIREEGPIEEGYSVRCLRDSAFWYLIGSSNRQSEKLQKYIYNTIKNTFGGFLFHMVCLRRFKDKIK